MPMTPGCTCPLPWTNPQSQTRSQTVSRTYPHRCRTTASDVTLVKLSSRLFPADQSFHHNTDIKRTPCLLHLSRLSEVGVDDCDRFLGLPPCLIHHQTNQAVPYPAQNSATGTTMVTCIHRLVPWPTNGCLKGSCFPCPEVGPGHLLMLELHCLPVTAWSIMLSHRWICFF